MGSAFLGIASGLTQGLASGVQVGASLVQQQRSAAIQQQQATAASINALQNSVNITDPAMRKMAVEKILPALGFNQGTPDFKNMSSAIVNGQTDYVNGLVDQLHQLGYNYDSRMIGQLAAKDPTFVPNMIYQAQNRANMARILQGLDTDQTQSSTGDMGTGAPGAGGTVAAPTNGGAGTSPAGGTQPAVVSPAPSSAPVAPVTAPVATAPATSTVGAPSPTTAVTTAPSTTAQPAAQTAPAAPIQAGTPAASPSTGTAPLPKVPVGQSASGSVTSWDPNTDPVVKRYQKVLLGLATAPGVTPEVISTVTDRMHQYIEGKKFQFTQFVDMQNLAVAKGNLSVAQYRASLDREHLNLEEQQTAYHQGGASAEPLSELAKEQHDVGTGQLSAGGVTGGVVPSATGSTNTRPLPATLTALPATQVTLPANVKPDLGKATNNGDGTFTITDAATLKAAGVSDPTTRLVIDAPTGKAYFQTATPTSLRQASALDDAQIALNLTQRGINFVTNTADQVKSSPQSFGAFGSAKADLQTVVGIAKDIGTQFPTAKDVLNATGLSKLPFDPKAPTLDGVSQFLKAYVTKTLTLAGGAAGLSAYSVTDKSIEDLTDVGAGSSNDVAAHLVQINNLLTQAKQDLQSRLPTGSGSGVPDTTGGLQPGDKTVPPPTDEEKAPLKSDYDAWQKMSPEQQKAAYGTKDDMRPSKYDADPAAATHLSKIPVGQIFKLQNLLDTYKNPQDQSNIKAYFNWMFGKTATSELGY